MSQTINYPLKQSFSPKNNTYTLTQLTLFYPYFKIPIYSFRQPFLTTSYKQGIFSWKHLPYSFLPYRKLARSNCKSNRFTFTRFQVHSRKSHQFL